jgi:hypothetical protein
VKVFSSFWVSNERRLRRVVGIHKFKELVMLDWEKWAYGRTSRSNTFCDLDLMSSAQRSAVIHRDDMDDASSADRRVSTSTRSLEGILEWLVEGRTHLVKQPLDSVQA